MDDSGSAVLQNVLFFGLLIVGFYLLAIRPQRRRAQALAQVRSSLDVGARVMTTAGIHGTVLELDGDTVLLEVAPGVPVRFSSAAVVQRLDPPAAESDDAPDAP